LPHQCSSSPLPAWGGRRPSPPPWMPTAPHAHLESSQFRSALGRRFGRFGVRGWFAQFSASICVRVHVCWPSTWPRDRWWGLTAFGGGSTPFSRSWWRSLTAHIPRRGEGRGSRGGLPAFVLAVVLVFGGRFRDFQRPILLLMIPFKLPHMNLTRTESGWRPQPQTVLLAPHAPLMRFFIVSCTVVQFFSLSGCRQAYKCPDSLAAGVG